MQAVLNNLDTEQETALLNRYKDIMKFAKLKKLRDMLLIVEAMTEKTVAKKTRWKPKAVDQEIIASLPLKKIDLSYLNLKKGLLDFSYKEDKVCRFLVDLLGGLTRNCLEGSQLLTEVVGLGEERMVQKYFSAQVAALRMYLELEMCQGLLATNGWLQRVLQMIKNSRIFSIEAVLFNHTDFELANQSTVLQEFFVFVGAHASSRMVMDIVQSTVPNLTPIYWLYQNLPQTTWLDVSPTFPASPLSFQRSASYRIGDNGRWKTQTA